MTFFANSGIVFPGIKRETQDAGVRTLEAGARLWQTIAHIEAGERGLREAERSARDCASEFFASAEMYSKIAGLAQQEIASRMRVTRADLATAALNDSKMWGAGSRGVDLVDLYFEMSARILRLARSLEALSKSIESGSPELVSGSPGLVLELHQPLTFQMMEDWEMIAKMARLIATLTHK